MENKQINVMEEQLQQQKQEEIQNDLTELVFILDKSGSMSGKESDTIGGFNAFVSKQRKGSGRANLTTILFSGDWKIFHDRQDISTVECMTEDDYCVGGCTALLDAIGGAITHVEKIHKYARAEDVPSKTLFVITTDGMENASNEFDAKQIKDMVEQKQKKDGWEFLFLGANMDAICVAEGVGIPRRNAVTIDMEEEQLGAMYCVLNNTVKHYRKHGHIKSKWGDAINVNKRKKGETAGVSAEEMEEFFSDVF